jgi:hypothetical protein
VPAIEAECAEDITWQKPHSAISIAVNVEAGSTPMPPGRAGAPGSAGSGQSANQPVRRSSASSSRPSPVAFSLFNTAPGWIDQQAAKLTPSK